jgi:hypothetical protein
MSQVAQCLDGAQRRKGAVRLESVTQRRDTSKAAMVAFPVAARKGRFGQRTRRSHGHASFAMTMKLYGGLTAEALESAAGTLGNAFEPKPDKSRTSGSV